MNKRVVVAMSGGVDSSVAAALLKNAGYEVIGITMCFNLPGSLGKRPSCCGIQGIQDAQRVAHKLGIRHYTLNMQKALNERVIKDFCGEYARGRTPNPCIRCNQFIKFDALLKKALALDAGFLATGHFARVIKKGGFYQLKKGKDPLKDQSYFLYRLSQGQLKHTLFPLGNYTKLQVRKMAREFGLPVADKPASQEICFLPGMDYRAFLRERIRRGNKPGPIIDKQGDILGRHKGIAYYTIGQRQGLGIAKGYPLYITGIDPGKNQLTVGDKQDALKKEFLIKQAHFIHRPLSFVKARDKRKISKGKKKEIVLAVKIRYNHQEAAAALSPFKNKIRVKFKKAQFAITPGQSAVFYDRDVVVGGGIIDEALS